MSACALGEAQVDLGQRGLLFSPHLETGFGQSDRLRHRETSQTGIYQVSPSGITCSLTFSPTPEKRVHHGIRSFADRCGSVPTGNVLGCWQPAAGVPRNQSKTCHDLHAENFEIITTDFEFVVWGMELLAFNEPKGNVPGASKLSIQTTKQLEADPVEQNCA